MTDYLLFLLLGLGTGAVYSLLGLGVVLEYRSSGVVNFAHGAMGMVVAYFYVSLTSQGELWLLVTRVPIGDPWGLWPALGASVVFAGVLGALIYLVIFRPLRSASALGKAVATVGLALAFEALAVLTYGASSVSSAPLLPTDPVQLGDLTVPADRIWLAAIAVVCGLGLWAISRFTTFGVATRAAAESEKGAVLLGFSPDRLAVLNWVLATVLAGVSGVLFIQISSLAPATYTLLIAPALAAAMMARFTSFGVVVAAAMALGMLQSEAVKLGGDFGWVPAGVGGALPFVMVLAAMAWRGQAIPSRGVLLERRAPKAARPRGLAVPAGLSIALAVVGLLVLGGQLRLGLIQSMVSAIVCLSFVVLTGYTGQISLAQMAFAGIGGFTLAKISSDLGLPFPLPLLVAGIVAVPVGLLVGLPALRVRGINLAIATLAGGVAIDSLAFNSASVNGGFQGAGIAPLRFLGLDLDINGASTADFPRAAFGFVALAVLAAAALAIANLRRTATGRRMLAVRANERAAAAVGIPVAVTKLYAFGVASFLAGIAGGMIGYELGRLSTTSFGLLTSLTFLAVAFVGGIARVSGAVLAGLFLATGGLVPVLLDNAIGFGRYQVLVAGILLVFSAIAYPDGMAATFDPPIAAIRRRLGRSAAPARAPGTVEPPPAAVASGSAASAKEVTL